VTVGWIAIAVIGLATMLIKAIGPVILGGRELPRGVVAVVTLLAPSLLAALVATQVFGSGRSLVVDERVVGLSVALVALALRAPVLVVVVAAAAATAAARLIT
jgi:hypothetical protein